MSVDDAKFIRSILQLTDVEAKFHALNMCIFGVLNVELQGNRVFYLIACNGTHALLYGVLGRWYEVSLKNISISGVIGYQHKVEDGILYIKDGETYKRLCPLSKSATKPTDVVRYHDAVAKLKSNIGTPRSNKVGGVQKKPKKFKFTTKGRSTNAKSEPRESSEGPEEGDQAHQDARGSRKGRGKGKANPFVFGGLQSRKKSRG